MSYYYGENGVLLPPFRIIAATALAGAAFHRVIPWKNRDDMAYESGYVCGVVVNNRYSVPVPNMSLKPQLDLFAKHAEAKPAASQKESAALKASKDDGPEIRDLFDTNFNAADIAEWELLFRDAPQYNYHFKRSQIASAFDRPLHKKLIASHAFERLREISFLGAIDYLFHPNGRPANIRHSRYDHTIGVALLSQQYCRLMDLSEADRDLLGAAALLHDIGHGPFSHTLEPEFARRFNRNHHQLTNQIITGEVQLDLSVNHLLVKHGVDPDEVIALLSKKSTHPHASLLSGPVNIDTLEGISRTKTYVHPNYVHCHPRLLLEAAVKLDDESLKRLDKFWQLKEDIYRNFIFGPMCFATDHLCREFVVNNAPDFAADDFLLTEKAFLQRHPTFKKFLFSLKNRIELDGVVDAVDQNKFSAAAAILEDNKTKVPKREFHINADVDVKCFADLSKRYYEEKNSFLRRVGSLTDPAQQAAAASLFD
ncbi:HD domain-containing protein [Thalassospira lucentensis]|uniref:HD domain-containing protein n=1 Tax=Thalassospira lucentensis TaxID=168935 RepID=UPI003AA906AE